jgi:hypothetical protein
MFRAKSFSGRLVHPQMVDAVFLIASASEIDKGFLERQGHSQAHFPFPVLH